jgi:hypothetical protein
MNRFLASLCALVALLSAAPALAGIDSGGASIPVPLPVASGGTNATTAATARTSLGVTATGADTGYAFRSNNLSDLASASTARSNLGVTATGADTGYAFRSNNLSDLASASTARSNLGIVTGTITPTLAFATPGTSSFSYTARGGNYVCTGNFVTGDAWIFGTITVGTASGSLLWTNLPYNIADVALFTLGLAQPVSVGGSWASLAATQYTVQEQSASTVNFTGVTGATISTIGTANVPAGTVRLLWTFGYPVSAC